MQRKLSTKNPFVRLTLAIFIAGCGILLMYYLLFNTSKVSNALGTITTILSPFILGGVMAYLMCPIYNLGVRSIYPRLKGKTKTNRKALAASKAISTIISMVVLTGVIAGFIALVIPNLIDTISSLVKTLPSTANSLINWMEKHIANNPVILSFFTDAVGDAKDTFVNWAQTDFLPQAGSIMSNISAGVVGVLRFALNFLIGLILCIYFLNSKELFRAQAKQMVLATFSEERAAGIFELGRRTNATFGGFINGKIIDSFIIGVICYILMAILNMPYAVFISVIVGVTNIIPFFGPFIGAIPSFLLILIVDPLKALYFAIMILALQQVDGNIIGPKILGNTTGLASFWVMFAIIVFGGMFGFIGMVVGVPIFALVYTYLGKYFHGKLRKKNLPFTTEEYMRYDKLGISDKEELQK
ncbi:MAG: AI-2E family transporter [Clostridia bacterium]|nr:AI-2E family transporter [Clostridia bacterium]